jgi:tetratricopeptide (TPR) repeat protein
MMDYSSVVLFVERARQSNRHFQVSSTNAAAIGAICRLVEGLPLAIELAAALTRHYTCAEIYNTLQRDYTILAAAFTDLPLQHRSMQAVLDYSWRFLTRDEARLLAACSIFVGSFTHQAAAAVTGTDMRMLHHLVDQSLLHVRSGRFAMHGLVRQYAAAQLAQSPEQQVRIATAHAAHYIELLRNLTASLVIDFAAQQHVWDEVENIRSAWQWSVCHESLALLEQGLESLYYFYRLTGMYREAIQRFEFALQRVRRLVADTPTDPQSLRLLTRLLAHIAEFYRRTDNLARGEYLAQEALTGAQRLHDSALQALAYHRLARLAYTRSNFPAMRDLAEAGYWQAQQADDTHLVAECLNDLGLAVSSCTGPLAALPHFHQALTLLQGTANRVLEAFVLVNLGFFSFAAGQYQAAYTFLQQGLALQRLLQDRGGRLSPLIHLGNLQSALGNYQEAQDVFEEVLALVQITGGAYWESWIQTSYGRWHHLNGDPSMARALCANALQTAQQNDIPLQQQWALVYLGHALADVGAVDAAAQHYQQAIALHKAGSWLHRTADAHAGSAALLLAQEQITDAVAHVDAALALLDEHGLAGAAEPFVVYWTAIRVLRRADDPRATGLLHTANRALHEIAGLLEEHSLRRTFLENVAVNRLLTAQM